MNRSRRPLRSFRRPCFVVVLTLPWVLMVLVGVSGIVTQPGSLASVMTGIAISAFSGWMAWRCARCATILVYDDCVVSRTFRRVVRSPWPEVDRFELASSASGYGGRGVTVAVVLASGHRHKCSEFWRPDAGRSSMWPDCHAIVVELNAALADARRHGGVITT